MKKISFLLFLLAAPIFVNAQLKVLAESLAFHEPEDGSVSLLLLKDGSTAYVHVTAKDGINVRLYDAQHKEIASKNLKPDFGKLKSMSVKGLYEINNELDLFISEVSDGAPSLYRLKIDKQTGDIKDLKTIATLKEINMGQGFASAFGGVPMPSFMVGKDALSDNYAVVRFNTFESDRNQRVELIQYAPDGTETGRVFLSSPEGKYKYTEIFDFKIAGKETYALLYSYNTTTSGGAANELLLATIKDGAVSYSNVGEAIKRRIGGGSIFLNTATGNLVFTTLEKLSTTRKGWNQYRDNYHISINVVDRQTAGIKKAIPLEQRTLQAKYRRAFKDEDNLALGYDGLVVNNDGTFTLMLEYTKVVERMGMQMGSTRSTITVGPSGTITFDEGGNEINTALIPKSQTLANIMFSGSIAGSSILNGGNQFKGVRFLKMKNKSYVLLNDVEENAERIKKGKLIDIKGLGDCEAWQYDLTTTVSPTLPIPQRTLLFPKEKEKEKNLVVFGASDVDFSRNIFVTLKVGKKEANVVWMSE